MRATGRRPHQLFLLSAAAWIGAAGGAFAHEPTRDAIPTSSLAALATRFLDTRGTVTPSDRAERL